jgi:mono/diheme cytochrome c family protein
MRRPVVPSSVVRVLLAAALVATAAPVPSLAAQERTATAPRSTRDGVYTFEQAKRGRDVFAGMCQSCHTATAHAEAPFRAKWGGRPLADLFDYVSNEMPKSEPGVLTMEEYVLVTAYLLRINGMPSGETPLTDDLSQLAQIRFDTLPASASATVPMRAPGARRTARPAPAEHGRRR